MTITSLWIRTIFVLIVCTTLFSCKSQEPCEAEGLTCEANQFCAELTNGRHTCEEHRAIGETCNGNDYCSSQQCFGDDQSNAVCVASCETQSTCKDHEACAPLEDGTTACLPQLEQRDNGAVCDSPRQCATGLCANYEGIGQQCSSNACSTHQDCPEAQPLCWPYSEDGSGLCGPEI